MHILKKVPAGNSLATWQEQNLRQLNVHYGNPTKAILHKLTVVVMKLIETKIHLKGKKF